MTLDGKAFWLTIGKQLALARRARTADDVIRIFKTEHNPYGDPKITGAPGFFAGSGGDGSLYDELFEAGWVPVWWEASYYWCLRAPDGSTIKYVEGDLYPNETRR
jgi:hypothetical protein